MEINNTLIQTKKNLNSESNNYYDPNNTMKNSINNLSNKNNNEIVEKTIEEKISISMIPKENNNKLISLEEEEKEEEYNIEDDEIFSEDNDLKLGYDSEDFLDINLSKIHGRSNYYINKTFDEAYYFGEMSKNLSLISKEPSLFFDNEESFTKEVDKMIQKYFNFPIKDNFLNILMIAEKPSIARTITKILSDDNYNVHHHETMTIFTFIEFFKGIKSYFTVTSVKGHIYNNKYVYLYDEDNPSESYNYKIKKILKNDEINIPKFLRYISKNKDILCLWIDCDPEGENICYEVVYNVLPYMNKKNYQQVYRANFSALTYTDINKAFFNLKEYPNYKLSMSVDARSIIDYKVGISFSKLLTSNILDYIDDDEDDINNKDVLSYGPCQTPSLWFCVQRKKERDNFIPTKSYQIYVEIKADDDKKYKIYMNKKYENESSVKRVFDDIKSKFSLSVERIITSKNIKDSPPGLKTTTMLKMASNLLGISPKEASDIAQKLYMDGYISYPRTGSTKYSPNFDFKENLTMFKYNEEEDYSNYYFKYIKKKGFKKDKNVQELINKFTISNVDFQKGKEKGGHQPIIPTGYCKNYLLEERNPLYKLICLYYLATLSPPLEYETKEYKMKVGDYSFKGNSSKIINEGFLKFQPFIKKEYISEFPSLKENKNYPIIDYGIEENISEPPQYLTEAELITEMEKYNIGTDGSIPSHIHNLSLRGYIKVDNERRLIPTKLGVALIDVLNIIEPDIIKPENREKIEKFVKEIERGKKSYKDALENAINFYQSKFIDCYSKIDELRKEFGKYFKLKSIYTNKYMGKRREKREKKRSRLNNRLGNNKINHIARYQRYYY